LEVNDSSGWVWAAAEMTPPRVRQSHIHAKRPGIRDGACVQELQWADFIFE
jgi:hypothetical protein